MQVENQVEFKKCTQCEQTKPISDFYTSSSTKDGYRCECKTCGINNMKTYQVKQKEKAHRKFLKMASDYKFRRNLKYKPVHGTKYVTYTCLECGKQHTTTWKLAHEVKFKCPTRSYEQIVKTIKMKKKRFKNKNEYNLDTKKQSTKKPTKLTFWQKIKILFWS